MEVGQETFPVSHHFPQKLHIKRRCLNLPIAPHFEDEGLLLQWVAPVAQVTEVCAGDPSGSGDVCQFDATMWNFCFSNLDNYTLRPLCPPTKDLRAKTSKVGDARVKSACMHMLRGRC